MPAVFVKSAFRPSDIPLDEKPQIALLGRSNVGKSALINHLANAKNLARVSATPGFTRAINIYEFDKRFWLVDLPGYGYSVAKKSRGKGFEGMISDYLSGDRELKLVLLIVDGRRGLNDDDRASVEMLQETKQPFAIVFNKIDKLSKSEAARSLCEIRDAHPAMTCIPHSITDGTGLGQIRDVIERAVRGSETDG